MGARILIIEDNATNLDLMAYLLNGFGHVVLSARDGLEGVAQAHREKPDLIICDVQLPNLDGYEVVRNLRSSAECAGIPIVAVTALAMTGDRERALEAGFDGYVSKPLDPEAFVPQIEAYLTRVSAASETSAIYDAVAVPQGMQESNGRSLQILAVDNVPANLELIRGIFEPFGYEVDTASGGTEALQKANLAPPDLIISDICMSEMSGYDLIRCVKATPKLAGIPFVFVTSTMLNESDRIKGLALGAARFLTRPIDPEDLLKQIESCFRSR